MPGQGADHVLLHLGSPGHFPDELVRPDGIQPFDEWGLSGSFFTAVGKRKLRLEDGPAVEMDVLVCANERS